MMTFDELEKCEAAFADRMVRRERWLFAISTIPVLLLVATFLVPERLSSILARTLVTSLVAVALFVVLSSKRFFKDVEVRCAQCGRSVVGLLGTAIEEVEYGEALPGVLRCPRCDTEIATAS